MRGHALSRLRDGLLSLIYPSDCQLCGGPVDSLDDGVACRACWEDPRITLLFSPDRVCRLCGAPARSGDGPCGACTSLPFSAARSCGEYGGAIEASILFLKSEPHLCPRLRGIIEQTVLDHRERLGADLIIPVPLHPHRRRERGFNQADLIARVISGKVRLPVEEGAVIRTKNTERHRAGLDRLDRERSLSAAFRVAAPRLVKGREVLLVDDLFTTGSTLSAAAGALTDAGAARVKVFTIGRVVPRRSK
ncbi:MAG TPA: ComF family protein [Blastocatellia bacterium]|nr:ComF family protein [Blastocatellia bacterium]